MGEVSRAGDELDLVRFHLGRCFLADEFDGHLGVLSVGELPELSQRCVSHIDRHMDAYSVSSSYSADGSWKEAIAATGC